MRSKEHNEPHRRAGGEAEEAGGATTCTILCRRAHHARSGEGGGRREARRHARSGVGVRGKLKVAVENDFDAVGVRALVDLALRHPQHGGAERHEPAADIIDHITHQ
jgi:hypothetical protein